MVNSKVLNGLKKEKQGKSCDQSFYIDTGNEQKLIARKGGKEE